MIVIFMGLLSWLHPLLTLRALAVGIELFKLCAAPGALLRDVRRVEAGGEDLSGGFV